MKENLRPGEKFPDIELPNHEGEVVRLSSIIRGFPTAVVFSRGYFCPKDRRQLLNYAAYLQPELIVNYCKLVIVSVDNPMISKEVRDGIGAAPYAHCAAFELAPRKVGPRGSDPSF